MLCLVWSVNESIRSSCDCNSLALSLVIEVVVMLEQHVQDVDHSWFQMDPRFGG